MARRTVVTLCAGSSGNHVLAADLGRRPEIELRLVTSDPAAFGPRIECEETLVLSDSIPLLSPTRTRRYAGTLDAVLPWERIDEACEGADIVVLTCPVHCHRELLRRVLPALSRPTIVGSLFAQGGLDWIFRDLCRELDLPVGRHTLFGLKRFPFLCKAHERGRAVRLHGRFPRVVVAFAGREDEARRARARALLGELLRKPVVTLPSFVSCTLGLSNQVLHPALSGALLRGFVPGRDALAEAPRLYGDCPAAGGADMCRLAAEFLELASALEPLVGAPIRRTLGIDPGVRVYMEWRRWIGRHLEGGRRYERLRDGFVAWLLRHNRRLYPARLPTRPDPHGRGLVPDFGSRFWLDDIPHGLCVVYGLGVLMGVPMPRTRALVLEHQAYMGRRYLEEAPADPREPFGPDLDRSGAPQRYGVHDRAGLVGLLRGTAC
ncbi:MAG: NAD/NADP octopine/nopaline dehydrogenase family protein [Myxococcales bacterium]|nr:NAD/NADP octopine/nopaline dehydrogenase family protein [Myxococcales bacterium]